MQKLRLAGGRTAVPFYSPEEPERLVSLDVGFGRGQKMWVTDGEDGEPVIGLRLDGELLEITLGALGQLRDFLRSETPADLVGAWLVRGEARS